MTHLNVPVPKKKKKDEKKIWMKKFKLDEKQKQDKHKNRRVLIWYSITEVLKSLFLIFLIIWYPFYWLVQRLLVVRRQFELFFDWRLGK